MTGMNEQAPPTAPRLKASAEPGTLIARTQLRGCAVPGCQMETHGMVLCPRGHWPLLPTRYRDALWAEYQQAYDRGLEPADCNGYKDALRVALRWLEENTEIPR